MGCVLYTLLFITVLADVKSAKILCVFPLPSLSHQIAFRSLTDELLIQNHEIDIFTVDPFYTEDKIQPNVTEFDIHNVTYEMLSRKPIRPVKRDEMISQLQKYVDFFIGIIKKQFASEEFQSLIKRKNNYDIIIADASSPTALVFTHIFKGPLLEIATTALLPIAFEHMGIPTHVLYYSNLFGHYNYNLTTYGKYDVIYKDKQIHDIAEAYDRKLHKELSKELFPDLPALHELRKNVHMFPVNSYSAWEGGRPYPPNTISFKFKTRVENKISQELQSLLDNSKNGVIYISFGTVITVSKLPENIIASMLNALSRIPFDVVLKSDSDELPNKPKNVKIFKFLPQANILMHPNTKLFITHGGQHSIDEAIDAGVPLIVIPVQYDQFVNSEKCVQHGIGKTLALNTLTEENILDAIKTVTEDTRYRENVIRVQSIFQDSPMKSMDRVLWAIEYIIRHGGAQHLRSPSANLSWAEYFELELLVYFLSISFIILFMIIKLILAILKFSGGILGLYNSDKKLK